ncbi:hypothetical protein CcCBS67573_g04046 [Chytriomyces confervae]|uniref:Radical SAM core domain-containing protein n=1 Tax=Chytriomyces confervae TaxID=246404 RepID=A0A507FEY2_9FUNG|nr:hypothetical protein CcCBS67573_g04046 [Chytriomyces confervae]
MESILFFFAAFVRTTVILITASLVVRLLVHRWTLSEDKPSVPVSVNFHFTRKCNYECGFCFHTATDSYLAPLQDAKKALALLKEAGMKKINFAGGEPFLYQSIWPDLQLESVSIVSNGSKIRSSFLRENAAWIDILAVSCDSFNEETNLKIGRGVGLSHVSQLKSIATACRDVGILFKINSVVCRYNVHEDLSIQIAPFRWKVFQVLAVEGENMDASPTGTDGDEPKPKLLRNVEPFLISSAEFDEFCQRHKHVPSIVPEPNHLMKASYLLMDEHLRFLPRGSNNNTPTGSILEVGVKEALLHAGWDEQSFRERGGVYEWTKPLDSGCAAKGASELEW